MRTNWNEHAPSMRLAVRIIAVAAALLLGFPPAAGRAQDPPAVRLDGQRRSARWMVLLTVCLWINCTIPAQRATCPAIEVSVVTDVPSDSSRSITLTDGRQILLTQTPLLTSADITGAHTSLTEGQYVLNVDMAVEGAERVRLFSERNVGRTLAFVVDGQVLRTPTIQDPITGDGFLIGAFERAQAERLADAINTGCRR